MYDVEINSFLTLRSITDVRRFRSYGKKMRNHDGLSQALLLGTAERFIIDRKRIRSWRNSEREISKLIKDRKASTTPWLSWLARFSIGRALEAFRWSIPWGCPRHRKGGLKVAHRVLERTKRWVVSERELRQMVSGNNIKRGVLKLSSTMIQADEEKLLFATSGRENSTK